LNLFTTWRAVSVTVSPMKFAAASNYLIAQKDPGLVFNTQWGHYHFLYFLNSQSKYVIGIDPTFMFLMDSGRYWLWRHVSNDEPSTCDRQVCTPDVARKIDDVIARDFGAAFVLVERVKNPRLWESLRASSAFREVHRDEVASVFAPAR